MASQPEPVTLSYQVVGGGAFQPPLLNYISEGQNITVPLSRTPTNYSMDADTMWNVSSVLPGSNFSLRWQLAGPNSAKANGQAQVLTYYRQYVVEFFLSAAGNARTFPFPHVNYTALNQTASTFPDRWVWIDYLSPYIWGNVSAKLPLTRWYVQNPTGVVNSTVISRTYVEQYLLSFNLSNTGPDKLRSANLTESYGQNTINRAVVPPGGSFWVDYNSTFAFQTAVYSSNELSRWFLHSISTSTARAPANVTVEYVEQYTLSVSFAVANGIAPSGPVLNTTSDFQPTSLHLYAGAPPIWADAGSPYSISTLLPGSTANERWITTMNSAGTVDAPTKVSLLYFHQAEVAFGFSVVGGGTIGPLNALYSYFGGQVTVPIGTAQNSVWADVGTDVRVNGTIASNSASERWQLGSSPTVVVTGPASLLFVYYHQLNIQVAYNVLGGGDPVPPTFTGSHLGTSFTAKVVSRNSTWVDNGSYWSMPQLLNGTTGERWVATGNTSGIVGMTTSFAPTYVHEFYAAVMANPLAGGNVSSSAWVPAGGRLNMSATTNPGWVFARWAGTGEASYSGGDAAISVVVLAPIQETAEFDLSFTVRAAGGGTVLASYGRATYSVGGNPLTFYVAPGTSVTLVAKPGLTDLFEGWRGISVESAAAVVVFPTAPVSVSANFAMNDVLVYGLAVLYCGVSVFAIAYLLRNRGVPLGRRNKGPGRFGD